MPQELTGLGEDQSADDALHALRVRVLRRTLDVLAVAMPMAGAFVAVQSLQGDELNLRSLALSIFTLIFPLLRLSSSRLGFRATTIALLCLLLLASIIVGSRGGVAVGNVALSVLVILLGTLFFGRRGATLGLIAVVIGLAIAGFAVVTGLVPPVSTLLWNPQSAGFWFRQILLLALLGLAIAAMQVYIVELLVGEAHALRRLAAHEQRQRLALEQAEREREHEREQRMLAQQALEESRRVEALSRLAGGIAHDFNNALTVILGTAEIAKGSLSSPKDVERDLDEIVGAARGAAELTRQLLALGRRQISKPRPVAMTPLLERLDTAFRRVVPDDIVFTMEAPTDIGTAHVDPAQLERALFNLVLNARDAMPRGGRLTISCRRETVAGRHARLPDGRYVALLVTDDGQGMDPETLEHAFEPFFTTKRVGAGTGLGLATVHAFAREAGGDIDATSTPGQGTTFTLLLPEYDGDEESEPSQTDPVALPTSDPDNGRVLVVEDRADVRASIVTILSRRGFDVSEAADGDRALALLAERADFALMCIDGVMPGTGTAAVIDRARQLAPAMRVLVCSGHVEEDLLRRGVSAGRYAFLAKPFSPNELLASVRGVLGSAGQELKSRDA